LNINNPEREIRKRFSLLEKLLDQFPALQLFIRLKGKVGLNEFFCLQNEKPVYCLCLLPICPLPIAIYDSLLLK